MLALRAPKTSLPAMWRNSAATVAGRRSAESDDLAVARDADIQPKVATQALGEGRRGIGVAVYQEDTLRSGCGGISLRGIGPGG